jgi:hypothetical protein
VEARDRARRSRDVRRNPRVLLTAAPYTDAHPGDDVAKLPAGGSLVPAAAAPAVALGTLVKRHTLAAAACSEAKLEGQGAIPQPLRMDSSC